MPKRSTGVYLRPGSNVYQWKIKVPLDLAHLYPGQQWAHRGTLDTTDLQEANRRGTRLSAEWHETFARQRKGSTPLEKLTPYHGQQMAHEALKTLLAKESTRVGGGLPMRKDILRALKHLGVAGMTSYGHALGWDFNESTPGATEAFEHFLKAIQGPLQSDLAEVPPAPPKPVKAYKLRDVFNEWKRLQGHTVTIDAAKARERALRLYEEATGNPALQDITRAMGHEFAQYLTNLPGASKTASDRLKYVGALLKFACQELEWTQRHPWEGIKLEYETEDKRKTWSPTQIEAFFALPLFTSYALPQRAKRAGADAAYWIPLLGLFTAARLGELVQLTVSDVVDVDDVWCIDINDRDGKLLKNEPSRRQTPIHSELIRLGFLDYWQDVKDAGHKALWPSLHLYAEKRSLGFSRWFNEGPRMAIRNAEGQPVEMPDFHTFRHTARTAMFHGNAPVEDRNRVTGHASTGSVGSRVYEHSSMARLKDAVEAIQYPSFTLERSYSREKLGVAKHD